MQFSKIPLRAVVRHRFIFAAFWLATVMSSGRARSQDLVLPVTFDVEASSSNGISFTVADGGQVLEQNGLSGNHRRAVMEFNISSIPDNATITNLTLAFQLNAYLEDPPLSAAINFYGYAGNGTPDAADALQTGTLLGGTGPLSDFSTNVFDVPLDKSLLQTSLATTNFLGIVGGPAIAQLSSQIVSKEGAALSPAFTGAPRLKVSYWTSHFPPRILGDYNRNGPLDAGDYTIWRDTHGSFDDLRADGNGDHHVDDFDYTIWKAFYPEFNPPGMKNGDFETGSLGPWQGSGMTNGTSVGGPQVMSFDVDGDGTPSSAVRLRVGQTTTNFVDPAGIGISQQFVVTEGGEYSLSVDIAAQNQHTGNISSPGRFELFFDNMLVDYHNWNGTSLPPNQVLRGGLTASLPNVPAGAHFITLRAIRSGSTTQPIYQYFDNILFTRVGPGTGTGNAIPEASSIALATFGLTLGNWIDRRRRR